MGGQAAVFRDARPNLVPHSYIEGGLHSSRLVDQEVVVTGLDDRAQIVSAVNAQYANVTPGFGGNDGTPVLITPAVPAAAGAFVLGSGICLAC